MRFALGYRYSIACHQPPPSSSIVISLALAASATRAREREHPPGMLPEDHRHAGSRAAAEVGDERDSRVLAEAHA